METKDLHRLRVKLYDNKLTPNRTYHLEVVTQFSAGASLLKAPRTFTFDKPLTLA